MYEGTDRLIPSFDIYLLFLFVVEGAFCSHVWSNLQAKQLMQCETVASYVIKNKTNKNNEE